MYYYAFLIFVLYSILWYAVLLWKFKGIQNIPGPLPLPFIGSLYFFLTPLDRAYEKLNYFVNKYGPIFKIYNGLNLYLVVTDNEFTEFILKSSKHITKDVLYDTLRKWLGNGLILTDGKHWHELRRIAVSAFNLTILKKILYTFNTSCDVMIEQLSIRTKTENIIDLNPVMKALTFDIISETSLGAKMNVQRNPDNAYIKAIDFLTEVPFKRICSIWKQNDFLFRFSNDYAKEKEAIRIVNNTASKIINERRIFLKQNNMESIKSENSNKRSFILIDHLFRSEIYGRPLNDIEILDFVKTITFAGTDTIAQSLSFLFYEIAKRPEIQNKLIKEIQEIFADDKDREIFSEDFHKMKYMELVIKESLRYNSTIPLFGRRLKEDVYYKGSIIPKTTSLAFVSMIVHRSPQYYSHPDKFHPERFLDEDKVPPSTFLAFSAGNRNCLGQKYAMALMKTAITYILRNFELYSAGPEYNVKVKFNITLSSHNGFHVRMKKRNC